MSALPPKADIAKRDWDVRFVPEADIEATATQGPLYSLKADIVGCAGLRNQPVDRPRRAENHT
jgi:hypothetical protein